jgi:hypothetical protein
MRHEALSLNFSTAKKKKTGLVAHTCHPITWEAWQKSQYHKKKLRKRSNGAHGRRI